VVSVKTKRGAAAQIKKTVKQSKMSIYTRRSIKKSNSKKKSTRLDCANESRGGTKRGIHWHDDDERKLQIKNQKGGGGAALQ